MDTDDCLGWVLGLRDQVVLITGALRLAGKPVKRELYQELISLHGARLKKDFARDVTLLVSGELGSRKLSDNDRGYSRKLVAAEKSMSNGGPHVHVVDEAGIDDLTGGLPAPCHSLRVRVGTLHIESPSELGILGPPLGPRAAGTHAAFELTLDLAGLDEGTAAHEATVRALIQHLSLLGIRAQAPAPGMPRFDAGWRHAGACFVAEVKSLSDANEPQQIRLGLGQVLDYAFQVSRTEPVTPVLVLEREPLDNRWVDVVKSAGVAVAWAPAFSGLGL